MKKSIFQYILYFPVLMIILNSCREQEVFNSDVVDGAKPVAKYSQSINGMTIIFSNESQNAESYYWNFGDGTSSTEQSPVHTYMLAGEYAISLKVNSSAGYSDTYSADPIFVAEALVAGFTFEVGIGMNVTFDATASKSIKKAVWDFGDGQTSEGFTVAHRYATEGEYTVTLTATGLMDDVQTVSHDVIVSKNTNLLKGSSMEEEDAEHWVVMQEGLPVSFGYTGDSPSGGEGGCLRFAGLTGLSASVTSTVYQGVNVEAGKKYKLSAQIKAAAGTEKGYFQFYISKKVDSTSDFIENNDNPDTNHFLCLNTWHGWGSGDIGSAIDGELYDIVFNNGKYGIGVATEGIYTATETGVVYIVIRGYTQLGTPDMLIDNVVFELQLED